MKKIVLIVILILVVVGIALTWFIISRQNQEEVLQSSSYVEMFGLINENENTLEYSFRENMTFDIVEISEANNGRNIATINVTMPDLVMTHRELYERYSNDNMTDDEAERKIKNYMQSHFVTVRRDFEVAKERGEWRIRNTEELNELIVEQVEALFIEILSTINFDGIFDVPSVPPSRR